MTVTAALLIALLWGQAADSAAPTKPNAPNSEAPVAKPAENADPAAPPSTAKPAVKSTTERPALTGPHAAIVERLSGRDRNQVQAAARELGAIGPEAYPTIAAAAKLNRLPGPLAAALAESGVKHIPAIAEMAKTDRDERVRVVAAQGLGLMGPAAVPAICELAASDDKYLRLTAFEALDQLTSVSNASVPDAAVAAIVAGATDEEQICRLFAVASLGRLGPRSPEVAATLVRSLAEDADGRVRARAADSLGMIARVGKLDPAAGESLIQALTKDSEAMVRTEAAESLSGLPNPGASVVAALTAALEDKFDKVREAAALALFNVGPAAAEAAPTLAKVITDDKHARARWYATGALGRLDKADAESLATLAVAIKDEDANVRAAASQALVRLGKRSGFAVPRLIEALSDEQPIVRENAATALGNLQAATAAEPLGALLKDPSPRVRTAAQSALAKLGVK